MNMFKELRKKQGWTQKEFARILGVERSTVAKWETGKTLPDARRLMLVCRVLQCKPEDLLNS